MSKVLSVLIFLSAVSARAATYLHVGPSGVVDNAIVAEASVVPTLADAANYYLAQGNAGIGWTLWQGNFIGPLSGNFSVAAGQPFFFSVSYVGANISFQWYRNGVAVYDLTSPTVTVAGSSTTASYSASDYSGASSAVIQFAAAQSSDAGIYTCILTSGGKTFTVGPISVTVK